MPSIKDIFSIIGIVLTVIFAVVVLLKTRKGAKRGAYQQPVHLGVVLIGAIVSFIATLILSSSVFTALDGFSMEELVLGVESLMGEQLEEQMRTLLLAIDPSTVTALLALPVAFLCPIIFTLCYFVLSFVTNLIFKIVCKAAGIKKRRDTVGKVVGAALGALEGVLVMTLFLVPISSIFSLATSVTSEIKTEDAAVVEVFDAMDGFTETPVMQLANFAGGDFLTRQLTTVHVKDSDVNLSKEIAVGFEIFNNISLLSNLGEGEISAEQRAAVDAIIAALERSDYLPLILSDATHVAAAMIFGNVPENPTAPEEKLTKALADMLSASTSDTIIEDVVMIKDVAFLLIDNGVLEALGGEDEEALMNLLTAKDEDGNTIIKQAIRLLTSNPRTTGVIAALNELSVALMCESLGIEGDAAQVYEDLKQGLNNVVAITPDSYETEEEYHEALGETLNETLVNNGIELEDEMLDTMTGYVGDYLEEARANGTLEEQLTDENVTEIILTYYDAYLQYQESGTVPELPGLPGGNGGSSDGPVQSQPENNGGSVEGNGRD